MVRAGGTIFGPIHSINWSSPQHAVARPGHEVNQSFQVSSAKEMVQLQFICVCQNKGTPKTEVLFLVSVQFSFKKNALAKQTNTHPHTPICFHSLLSVRGPTSGRHSLHSKLQHASPAAAHGQRWSPHQGIWGSSVLPSQHLCARFRGLQPLRHGQSLWGTILQVVHAATMCVKNQRDSLFGRFCQETRVHKSSNHLASFEHLFTNRLRSSWLNTFNLTGFVLGPDCTPRRRFLKCSSKSSRVMRP